METVLGVLTLAPIAACIVLFLIAGWQWISGE